MDPITLQPEHTGDGIPTIFRASLVIPKDEQDTSVSITCIEVFGSNLYVGTDAGSLKHYHLFEDATEYLLISEVPVSSTGKPVKKMLILPGIERAMVLCGSVVSVFSLPEMSPLNIGKLKAVTDIHTVGASTSVSTNGSGGTAGSMALEVIVFTSSKIRLVQVTKELLKLVSDLSYTNAVTGISMAAAPVLPNAISPKTPATGTGLALVANKKNYDIVDLKQVRKIPLFEYTQELQDTSTVFPHIVRGNGDYMLTIKSDETSSIGMFIDFSGNVTRGTISWEAGYPESIAIDYPYVFAIFPHNKLVITSIETLEVVYDGSINLNVASVATADTLAETLSISNAVQATPGESTGTDAVHGIESKADAVAASEPASEPAEAGSDLEVEIHPSLHTQPIPIAKQKSICITQIASSLKLVDKELLASTSIVDPEGTRITNASVKPDSPAISSVNLLYDKSQVWVLYKEDTLRYVESEMKKIPTSGFGGLLSLLESDNSHFSFEILQYQQQLKFLLNLFSLNIDSTLKSMLQTDPSGKLLVDPKFILHTLDEKYSEEVLMYSGIFDILKLHPINKKDHFDLLIRYLKEIYAKYISTNSHNVDFSSDFISKIRLKLYHNDKSLAGSKQIIDFIDKFDIKMFNSMEQDSANKSIRFLFTKRGNYLTLIYLYKLSVNDLKPAARSVIGEEICRLSLKLYKGELKDNDYHANDDSKDLLQALLKQLSSIYNEKVYTSYLLEVLKADPEIGLKYMKQTNSNTKYKAINKHILSEISETSSTKNLTLLKIEYLESMIKLDSSHLDYSSIDDLLLELCQRTLTEVLNNDTNFNNFMVLQETYKLENLLEDPIWPKIKWVDYLRVNMQRSECREFAENYLKILELLIVRKETTNAIDTIETKVLALIESNPLVYGFYKLILEPSIQSILDICDYSSSEYFAIHGYLPFPSDGHYFKTHSRITKVNLPMEQQKVHLNKIFAFYSKDPKNVASVRHFINGFGCKYFTTLEILSIIPSNVPIFQVQEYLTNCLIELGANHRHAFLSKVVGRSNEREIKQVLNEVKQEAAE